METHTIILAVLIGATLTAIIIPPVVRVSVEKHLFDIIDKRKIHNRNIPPLGGVGIYLGLVITTTFLSYQKPFPELIYIYTASLIIFFTGLKDDLVTITAMKKTLIELVAIVIVIVMGDIRLTHFHEIFGITLIDNPLSYGFTILFFLALINSYNLIDGVDGLASGLGIMVSFLFGIWFMISGHMQYAIMAFALVGSLLVFFQFNVFGTNYKVFLGDTGSLVLGFLIAIFCLKFNEMNISDNSLYFIESSPSVSFAIVSIPLIDTIRIMFFRIIKGNSPFSPDKNHIHHKLLHRFKTHLKVSLIIISANLSVVLLALLMNFTGLSNEVQFFITFIYALILSVLPDYLIKNQQVIEETDV